MQFRATKLLFLCLTFVISAPSRADRNDHEWRNDRGYGNHRHHHNHHYRRQADGPCRIEGWYDRYGYYRERQICREARISAPGPTLMIAPPTLFVQPPGIFIR